jgi:hypothetical protein
MDAKLRLSVLLLIVGVAFAWPCLISPQSASAQATVVSDNVQIAGSECGEIPGIGPYCAEYVAHIVYRTVITPSGRINGDFHQNLSHFEGILGNGLSFNGQAAVNGHENFSGDAPYSGSYTYEFTAVTQGSADNFIVSYTLHMTVNANGEVTAYIDNWRAEFRG